MSTRSPRPRSRPSPLLIGLGLGALWLVLLFTLVQGVVSVGVLQAAALLIYATTVAVMFLLRRPDAPLSGSSAPQADPWGDQLRAAFGDVPSLSPDRGAGGRVPTGPSALRNMSLNVRIPTEPSGVRGLSFAEPLPDDAIELLDLEPSLDADPPTGVHCRATR